jgi:sugar lactone lactonase YvrE
MRRLLLLVASAVVLVVGSTVPGAANNGGGHGVGDREKARNTTLHSSPGVDDGNLLGQQAQYNFERTAPAAWITGDALASAVQQAGTLPVAGGAWQEVTNAPYNEQPANYTDPFWSNIGAGFSLVGGRTTALARTPDGAWFAGEADGGVWKSTDQGQHWTPLFDSMPTLSIGSLAVDPVDGSLWVGTGEANVSQDSYMGTGVYKTVDGGATFTRVGDDSSGNNPLVSRTSFRLAFDSAGDVYDATDNGLFRLAAGGSSWVEVLDPAGPTVFPPYKQQVTDVAVVPGSGGARVIAAIGWHGGGNTTYNGYYQSTNGGLTFGGVTVTGDIQAGDIGRTTFAYSADGSKLYAIVQSISGLATGSGPVLQGFFVASGSPASVAGPWKKIATADDLTKLPSSAGATFGQAGQQAWYNEDLAVDPANPNHVYAGLEEVYQSNDGGATWVTISPYWNYNFKCDYTNPPTCPNTTHPDQHAMMIADGKIVIGNDGGVYSRALSDANANDGTWSNLNATLHSWQYYDARAGRLGGHGVAVWGGTQDNGTSTIATGFSQVVVPAGGDGFNIIVDPQNGNKMAGEYVDGTMYSSTDGGHSFADFVSPTCVAQGITGLPGGPRADCDPGARFVTPITQDLQNKNVWLLGGEDVWVSPAGWHTACTNAACTWQNVYDTGGGHSVTALSSANGGQIIYAAWTAGGGNPGGAFGRGIATNYGGTWHELSMASLPNRFIAGVTVDENNPAHAYAIFNGYSRRFVPGGGVGHVFETMDGGGTWTDISGNLPDIASDALVISGGHLALATDAGVFTAAAGQGTATTWSRLGTGLPNVVVDDLTEGPDGNIYAATHGRGIWRIAF